jgi:hypothetical protein
MSKDSEFDDIERDFLQRVATYGNIDLAREVVQESEVTLKELTTLEYGMYLRQQYRAKLHKEETNPQ